MMAMSGARAGDDANKERSNCKSHPINWYNRYESFTSNGKRAVLLNC